MRRRVQRLRGIGWWWGHHGWERDGALAGDGPEGVRLALKIPNLLFFFTPVSSSEARASSSLVSAEAGNAVLHTLAPRCADGIISLRIQGPTVSYVACVSRNDRRPTRGRIL
ncbi:unnamed protein product [Musa banksii]